MEVQDLGEWAKGLPDDTLKSLRRDLNTSLALMSPSGGLYESGTRQLYAINTELASRAAARAERAASGDFEDGSPEPGGCPAIP
jgi:hypothetical protein